MCIVENETRKKRAAEKKKKKKKKVKEIVVDPMLMPSTEQPMLNHTFLQEGKVIYHKTDNVWVDYGQCVGFRYNVSGPFTQLRVSLCMVEEGDGNCISQSFNDTNGLEVSKKWKSEF